MELRTQLLAQFNAILQTRDTARGLIVNMSDVLFDTGKYSLRPLAREKLAKVAGIVSGHPGLRLDVEGYTDSVGGDDYNQQLSEQRGEAVRDYLTHEGMAAGSVSAKGFGKSQPVASNDTAEGRQQNRRVELVISGEVIGRRSASQSQPASRGLQASQGRAVHCPALRFGLELFGRITPCALAGRLNVGQINTGAPDQTVAWPPCWTLGRLSPGSELARMNRQTHDRHGPSTSDTHCGDPRRIPCIVPGSRPDL